MPFLQAVRPEVAIYSAGQGNTYGHPHDEVLQRLAGLGIPVYGTDAHGTIRLITDGTTVQLETQFGAEVGETLHQPAQDGCQPGQVDINSASRDQLMRIQHIGPARSEDLIRLRPFSSVDDLVRISGIASARLADIKAQGLACVP